MTFLKSTTRTAVMTLRDGPVLELEIQSGLGCMRIEYERDTLDALDEILSGRRERTTTRGHVIERTADPRFGAILTIQGGGSARMPLTEENHAALLAMLAHRF